MRVQAIIASASAYFDQDPQLAITKLDSLDPFEGAGSTLTSSSTLATVTDKLWIVMEEKNWRPFTHDIHAHFLQFLLSPSARFPPPPIGGDDPPVRPTIAMAIIFMSLLENLPSDFGIQAVEIVTTGIENLVLRIARTTHNPQQPVQTFYFDLHRGPLLLSYEEEPVSSAGVASHMALVYRFIPSSTRRARKRDEVHTGD